MITQDYCERRKGYLSEVTLCQYAEYSCGGCCINLYENSKRLLTYVKENTLCFKEFFKAYKDISPHLLKEYYFSRISKSKKRDLSFFQNNCIYLGYIDDKERIGCLIHPARLGGIEIRHLAFNSFCNPRAKCYRDIIWEHLSPLSKEKFRQKIKGADWLTYSRYIMKLIPSLYWEGKNPPRKANRYFKLVTKDYGIGNCRHILENLDLIYKFFTSKKQIKNLEFENFQENYIEYGEMWLEKGLLWLAKRKKLNFQRISIPNKITRIGQEFIQGESIYLITPPTPPPWILLGTSYDDIGRKLSNKNKWTATAISFLISIYEELALANYGVAMVFWGGEQDWIKPLAGSRFFLDKYPPEYWLALIEIKVKEFPASGFLLERHLPVELEELSKEEAILKEILYSQLDRNLNRIFIYLSKSDKKRLIEALIKKGILIKENNKITRYLAILPKELAEKFNFFAKKENLSFHFNYLGNNWSSFSFLKKKVPALGILLSSSYLEEKKFRLHLKMALNEFLKYILSSIPTLDNNIWWQID